MREQRRGSEQGGSYNGPHPRIRVHVEAMCHASCAKTLVKDVLVVLCPQWERGSTAACLQTPIGWITWYVERGTQRRTLRLAWHHTKRSLIRRAELITGALRKRNRRWRSRECWPTLMMRCCWVLHGRCIISWIVSKSDWSISVGLQYGRSRLHGFRGCIYWTSCWKEYHDRGTGSSRCAWRLMEISADTSESTRYRSQRGKEQSRRRGSARSCRSCLWPASRGAYIMPHGCSSRSLQHASWTTMRGFAHRKELQEPMTEWEHAVVRALQGLLGRPVDGDALV